MEKEFNLSEKMKENIQIEEHILHCGTFEKEDVKEFIKKLKRSIAMIENKGYYVFDEGANWLLTKINKEIDKLAGEKLK